MLRSSSRPLQRGLLASTTAASTSQCASPSLATKADGTHQRCRSLRGRPTLAATEERHSHTLSPALLSQRHRRPTHNLITGLDFYQSVHSVPYFYFSRPDFLPSRSSSSHADFVAEGDLGNERYMPPLPDVQFLPQNEAQETLARALQSQDADSSWKAYIDLGSGRHSLPRDVVDWLLVLQCRKPVKSCSSVEVDKSLALIRHTCNRILRLSRERLACGVGGSGRSAECVRSGPIAHIPAGVALRLLYHLAVEFELEAKLAVGNIGLSSPPRMPRANLVRDLSARLDAVTSHLIDAQLRGRVILLLAGHGETDFALRQLHALVEQAKDAEATEDVDHRPFERLLLALAEKEKSITTRNPSLPSPIDKVSVPETNHPLVQALHLTLASDAPVSTGVVRRCLRSLDSATLGWLLTLETQPDSSAGSTSVLDDRTPLKTRWHPWQSASDGLAVAADAMDAFCEQVALVLAQRGVLQPALYLIESLTDPSSHDGNSDGCSHSHAQRTVTVSETTSSTPDHDLFAAVIDELARRMQVTVKPSQPKSSDTYRALLGDLRLVLRTYAIAAKAKLDTNQHLHKGVIRAFVACLPFFVLNLGPRRSRFTDVKPQLAERNEKNGSRRTLQMYLRRFTTLLLARDPDLARQSLSLRCHAILLGLFLRTRDYSFSKRLYRLFQLREPEANLWSDIDPASCLLKGTFDPLSAPDHTSFGWFFAESIRATSNPQFALQLYRDWTASGNVLPAELTALLIQALLRSGLTAEAQRVLADSQDRRMLVSPRLARILTTSLSDAGFPTFAMEMAGALASQRMAQEMKAPAATRPQSRNARAHAHESAQGMGPSLKLLSIALDRASNARAPWTLERKQTILRQFEDFRLGLTHHMLRGPAKHGIQAPATTQTSSSAVTIQVVRAAYNAVMRAVLAPLSDDLQFSPHKSAAVAVTSDADTPYTDGQMQELFDELRDIGVDPDGETWTLLLHASLQCPASQSKPKGSRASSPLSTEQLLKAMHIFRQGAEASFIEDGPFPDDTVESPDAAERAGTRKPVLVREQVVAELMYGLCDADKADLAVRIYSIFRAQQRDDCAASPAPASSIEVEKAYLCALALQGKETEWQEKVQQLNESNKGLKLSSKFLRKLIRHTEAS
ncbi:hypothetical protein BCV70DRAFT_200619 [Testicularia cyperi]|uniref:Uncharacterized protein n=1 Tax=Testicularia cyperi TaxID=1882483 RepID=A0A317XNN2_9BASI|nr:hypothetical protein BCV70DRAFT_200619 [Testicularia cyperi]